jgi:hypothetical protein
LINKWRRTAQKCAERVFVDARNRIDRMGGFKEYMTRQREFSQGNQFEDGEAEIEGEEERENNDENKEEEFTMEFMLKMAGVEEGLIGWDRALNNFRKG